TYPTGRELIESYLAPLATRTALRDVIRTSQRVTAISRTGFDKAKSKGRAAARFELRTRNGKGDAALLADAVIDVSGTWFSPNPAGGNGLPALGEAEHAPRIAYGMPDVRDAQRSRYAGRTVAVLGGGHSAVGTLLDLAALAADEPGTQAIWLLRADDPAKSFGGGSADQLAARGELGMAFANLVRSERIQVETGFSVARIEDEDRRLKISARSDRRINADELIVATGFRPDLSLLSELRLRLDPAIEAPVALAPLIDPNEHSCGTVRPHGARELAQADEPGLYLAGMKSYGRAPTFLMITGYEQVRSITADIAGDKKAAARVELTLPETGVCTRGGLASIPALSGCCGGPAPSGVESCCADDAKAKAAGRAGCGCA
ncbi:FAD-dependent oxidoreductase, partial [Bradyrhizobium sp. STM 3809]|uniref:FAD-dependent oxidoreductase n=1 Tax=Bradyrhizobium sp. STM 3809 TaxID=551936 RepID=UPI0005554D7E